MILCTRISLIICWVCELKRNNISLDLQVVTNRETQETLLCLAYVFEVVTDNEGPKHRVYRLIKENWRWPPTTTSPNHVHNLFSASINTKHTPPRLLVSIAVTFFFCLVGCLCVKNFIPATEHAQLFYVRFQFPIINYDDNIISVQHFFFSCRTYHIIWWNYFLLGSGNNFEL